MIGVIGVATVRSLDMNIENKLNIENEISSIKVMKSTSRSFNSGIRIECEIKFRIQLKPDCDCKSSEDYTGKVYPFLKNLLDEDVNCVQIIDIVNLGTPLMKHITEI